MNGAATLPLKPCKKALLIGICYSESEAPLHGPHGDVDKVEQFLNKRGFRYADIVVMKDLPTIEKHLQPSRDNILMQMQALVQGPYHPDDSRFFYYSGHGSQVPDDNGDEKDYFDECIHPVESIPKYTSPIFTTAPQIHRRVTSDSTMTTFSTTSSTFYANTASSSSSFPLAEDESTKYVIRDDTLYKYLVEPLPPKARLVALFDSCHSGSILDLPWQYSISTGRPKHRGIREYWEGAFRDLQQDVQSKQQDVVRLLDTRLSHRRTPHQYLLRPVQSGLQMMHGLLGKAVSSIRKKDGKSSKRDGFFESGDALRAKKDVLFSNASRYVRSRDHGDWLRSVDQLRAMRMHLQHVRTLAAAQETSANVVLISGCKDAQLSEEIGLRGEKQMFGVLTSIFLETLSEAPSEGLSQLDFMSKLREKCKKDSFDQLPQLSTGHAIDPRVTAFFL